MALEDVFWKFHSPRGTLLDTLVWTYIASQHLLGISTGTVSPGVVLIHLSLHALYAVETVRSTTLQRPLVSLPSVLRALVFSFITRCLLIYENALNPPLKLVLILFYVPMQITLHMLGLVSTFSAYLAAHIASVGCAAVLCTGPAVHYLLNSNHAYYAIKALAYLDSAFTTLTTAPSRAVTDGPCSYSSQQMHVLVLFVQFYAGLVLPAYIAYFWELRAKLSMLLQLQHDYEGLADAISSPAALLACERGYRPWLTHALLHTVLLMPLCWSLASCVPREWLVQLLAHQPVSINLC